MALLVENFHLLVGNSRQSSTAEVLYAASWICGEFASHLDDPEATLLSMLKGKINLLPGHIQAVYVQNSLKLFCFISEKKLENGDTEGVKQLAKSVEEKIALVSCNELH
jgi:AP-3 complex subunit delta-1